MMSSSRWRLAGALLLVAFWGLGLLTVAQEPVPTLVPPTPIPRAMTDTTDALLTQSGVARIAETGVLRVGVLYNEAPYAELQITGTLAGYEPDVARALAEAWDVELELVQVTRQNRIDKLVTGEIDLLMSAMVHERELDARLDFSQTYRLGRQAVMMRADETVPSLINLANRRIGYVIGTPGDAALEAFIANSGVPLQREMYFNYDQALAALFAGEIDGVAGRRERLLRAANTQLEAISLLDQALAAEPFAVALPRQDINLRHLVNRTLQYLLEDGTLEALHEEYFPGEDFPFDAMPLWNNIGEDAPQLSQVSAEIVTPQNTVIPRLTQSGILRVAGAQDPESLPQDQRTIQEISRAVVEQVAARWGMRVEFVGGDPVNAVESGQADIALALQPDWSLAERLDFSQPYLLHGDRLLVRDNSGINTFSDLRGNPYIAVVRDDSDAQDRAQGWADSVNRRVRFFTTDAQGIAISILDDLNANVAFGDSLYLLPQQRASAGQLVFTPRWYSRRFVSFGLPRNDVEFRLLMNYTLQEMVLDNTLRTLLAPVTPPDEQIPRFDIWPGSSSYLGFDLR